MRRAWTEKEVDYLYPKYTTQPVAKTAKKNDNEGNDISRNSRSNRTQLQ